MYRCSPTPARPSAATPAATVAAGGKLPNAEPFPVSAVLGVAGEEAAATRYSSLRRLAPGTNGALPLAVGGASATIGSSPIHWRSCLGADDERTQYGVHLFAASIWRWGAQGFADPAVDGPRTCVSMALRIGQALAAE
eukprot:354857-Chlamydomonas_euryale.AAC.56